jgi:hypothetical protein
MSILRLHTLTLKGKNKGCQIWKEENLVKVVKGTDKQAGNAFINMVAMHSDMA